MPRIEIKLPDEMAQYADVMEYFFKTMVQKLYTNRHKGFDTEMDLMMLLGGAKSELEEVEQALDKKGQFEVAVEAADLANMAFLIALTSLSMTRASFDDSRRLLLTRKMMTSRPTWGAGGGGNPGVGRTLEGVQFQTDKEETDGPK